MSYKDQRIAVGSDFDKNTGQIAEGKKVLLLGEEEARKLETDLASLNWLVKEVEENPSKRSPAPPFITSTLQQEANRKLRLSPRKAMQVAQGLYEKGFITYMRTDSVQLSEQAVTAARECVSTLYGKEFLSEKPRQYSKKVKGAQEAHEAIRPSGSEFKIPNNTGLSGLEFSLYELIWKRTVATQMADAEQVHVKVDIEVGDAVFRASGKRIDFAGFFRAYVEGSDNPDAEIENKEIPLPPLKKGLKLEFKNLEAKKHETQPPARYTEASLVKKLESEGIGRPSTYATIIDTIVHTGIREYCQSHSGSKFCGICCYEPAGISLFQSRRSWFHSFNGTGS